MNITDIKTNEVYVRKIQESELDIL